MVETVANVKYVLNMEVKPEKYESKQLVLGNCRCTLYSSKVPAKPNVQPSNELESTIHYLDIQGIESMSLSSLRLTLKNGKVLSFAAVQTEADEIGAIICHIVSAVVAVFPTVPLERLIGKMEIYPPSRAKVVEDAAHEASLRDSKPCDGFSSIYTYMCDYLGYAAIDEVTWDIDTIYSSQDARCFSLYDFSHLSSSDHVPLLAALQYSTWFTHFNAAEMKLSTDMLSRILKVLKTSVALESIDFSGSGLKAESAQKLAAAISANTSSRLVELDLSNNLLEDRGVTALSTTLSKLPRGLCRLNLSRTGMTAKGLGKLAEALLNNSLCVTTLRYLNLSSNMLKNDEMQHLQMFLAKPNVLEEVDFSNCGIALEQLISPMAAGCVKYLRILKASGNPYTIKKSKDPPPYWKQFFSTAQSLETIGLSSTSLPPNALKALLLGLSINEPSTAGSAAAFSGTIGLDVSQNALGAEGAGIISACVQVLNSIGSLDLTNNGMEEGLSEMLASFKVNSSIRHLAIGQNFAFSKLKHLTTTLDALVEVMQSDRSVLESLSISNSKLGPDTSTIINVLGSNMSIRKVDLSGNDMGDDCAKMLAKALSINTTLVSLSFDRNSLTATGLSDIANAIHRNMCVQEVPLPIDDIIVASKLEPDKVKAAVETIQKSLLRNCSVQRLPLGTLYRLQENIHAGAAQAVTEGRFAKLQMLLPSSGGAKKSLKGSSSTLSADKVKQIELARKDVASAKKAMSKLHSIAQRAESDSSELCKQVGQLSEQLVRAIHAQSQSSAEEMLRRMQEDFPFVFSFYESIKGELSSGCEARIRKENAVPYSHTAKKLLLTEARNELSRLNVSVATYLFDHIVEKLLCALDECSSSAFVDGVVEPPSPRVQARAEEPKGLRNDPPKPSSEEDSAHSLDAGTAASSISGGSRGDGGNITSSATTRKALIDDRKRRPQSLHQEQPLAKSGGLFAFVGSGRRRRKASVEILSGPAGVGDEDDLNVVVLPSDVPKLSHPTKDRPKPQRVHMPMQKPSAEASELDAAEGLLRATPAEEPRAVVLDAGRAGAQLAVPKSAAVGGGPSDAKAEAATARSAVTPQKALLPPTPSSGKPPAPKPPAPPAFSKEADAQPTHGNCEGKSRDSHEEPGGESTPQPQAPMRAKKVRSKRDMESQLMSAVFKSEDQLESTLSASHNTESSTATSAAAAQPDRVCAPVESKAMESKRLTYLPTTSAQKNLASELKLRNKPASPGLILERSLASESSTDADVSERGEERGTAASGSVTVGTRLDSSITNAVDGPAVVSSKPAPALPSKPPKPSLVPRAKQGPTADVGPTFTPDSGKPHQEMLPQSSNGTPTNQQPAGSVVPREGVQKGDEPCGSSSSSSSVVPHSSDSGKAEAVATEASASLTVGPVRMPPLLSGVHAGAAQHRTATPTRLRANVVSMPPEVLSEALSKAQLKPSPDTSAMSSSMHSEVLETTFDEHM